MFDIWYCLEYPLDEINFSTKVHKVGSDEWRPALAKNISEQGLVNPLIVLNHRDPQRYKERWLKTGNNRLWALKNLGWTHAPCLVTGICDHPAKKVNLQEANSYIKDGELECVVETHGAVLQLKNTCKPEDYEYPNG